MDGWIDGWMVAWMDERMEGGDNRLREGGGRGGREILME